MLSWRELLGTVMNSDPTGIYDLPRMKQKPPAKISIADERKLLLNLVRTFHMFNSVHDSPSFFINQIVNTT